MSHFKRKRALRSQAALYTMSNIMPNARLSVMNGSLEADVLIVRMQSRALDDDNWIAACKPVRDGIADAFMLQDNAPNLTWAYSQEKHSARKAVRIEIHLHA